MPMKVEAAIITQKRPAVDFNTDSVNINGKVFSRDVIKNGYKGSGVLNGNVFFALTSSAIEGFADAAVTALNSRAEKFAVARDPRSVFSGYFEDCKTALLKMNKTESDLVSACLYASGRKVVLARNGSAELFLYRADVLSAVKTEKFEDTVADFDSSVFPDVTVGDIFVMVSPGVSAVLSKKEIEDILRVSDGSVKKTVSLISKVASTRDNSNSVSVIAVKILETALEDDISANGFVPVFDGEKKNSVENEEENAVSSEENNVDNGENSEEKKDIAKDPENGEVTEEETEQTGDANDIAAAISASVQEKYDEILSAEETSAEDDKREVPVDENEKSGDVHSDDGTDEDKKRLRSKIKLLIALSSLLLISVILFVALLVMREFPVNGGEENTTVAVETTLEETSKEEATQSSDETSSEENTTVAEEDTAENSSENSSEEESSDAVGEDDTTEKASKIYVG